jgi:cytochrome b subunit of formate dehydrogenase
MIIFRSFLGLNLKILLLIVVVGIAYLIKNAKRAEEYIMVQQYVNVNRYNKLKRLSWIICAVFIIVCVLAVTGIHFGSNLWFWRPVRINGPYQFALIVSNYLPPFFTIIIPLFIGRVSKLLEKYEVGEKDEE